MIEVRNAVDIHGGNRDYFIPSAQNKTINAEGLLAFPGLIDGHVHFRTPGFEYKENWISGAQAAVHGGITTVFDMPNTNPVTTSLSDLQEKKALINSQLSDIPLRYQLYLGADRSHFDEISRCKDQIAGIKVFMGSSTGNLLVDDDQSLSEVFKLAAQYDLVVALHAEDEKMIEENSNQFKDRHDALTHSLLRTPEVAAHAIKRALALSKPFNTKLYFLHISSQKEIELIAKAKQEGRLIYAETTPHHLFLDTSAYEYLGTFAQVNPPLRSPEDRKALWQAVNEGIIDTLGSDHAPHTIEEKRKPYREAPSGMPGIETMLPLMLNAYNTHLLSLEKILSLMHTRITEIFHLPTNDDLILIDLKKTTTVEAKKLHSRSSWSAFEGTQLTGHPVCTIVQGQVYDFRTKTARLVSA